MNILVEHLSHTFPGKPPRPALADVNFSIPTGQFCAVLGPSGCGKTTLLRLAAGLLPTTGQIRLDGQLPAQTAAQRRIAWLAQSPALFPWLTARANVALVSRFAQPGARGQLSPQQALARVGLADAEQVYPFQLSGGMQQRLALARLLCQGADVWLMDEPFAALDALTRERLAAELLAIWQPLRRFGAPLGGQYPEGQPLRRFGAPLGENKFFTPFFDGMPSKKGVKNAPPPPESGGGGWGVEGGQPPTVLWVTHHIHEAMRLADRALVLSPCPGTVVLDLAIDLPRPRREDTPGFQAGLRELKAALGLVVAAEAA